MNLFRTFLYLLLTLAAGAAARAQEGTPLSLADCRAQALARSETLRQADNHVQQAELDRRNATSAALPRFDASASAAYVVPDIDMLGMELRMRGMYLAGLTLTQPLYTGGKIRTGKRLARIGQAVAAEQLRQARMDVIEEADKTYWTCIAVRSQLTMLETCVAQLDTLYLQTRRAVDVGLATDNDLLRVEARRSDLRYQLQKARSGAELCRQSLCSLIGADSEARFELTENPDAPAAVGPLPTDVGARPEIRLLQQQVEASREQVRLTRADRLPTVALMAGHTYYGNIRLHVPASAADPSVPAASQEFRDGIGAAMLTVSIPLFHWGENRRKEQKARLEVDNAQLELQRAGRQLQLQASQAAYNLTDADALVQTARVGLQQADEHLRVTQSRHAAQLATLSDLLDAQAQWQQAQSHLIEAQTQRRICETEYRRATGSLE